jgi:hypothetical protein
MEKLHFGFKFRYVSALHYYFKEDNPIFTNYKKVLNE